MSFRHYRGTKPPRFAHPAEEELAELLDENAIPWEYEPHTFTLERAADGPSARRSRPTSISRRRTRTSSAP